ncbi:MAG: exonuclease domain-containing protein, partial [bacterium]
MNQVPVIRPTIIPDPSSISPPELARLGLARFVALDFETTGLDPKVNRIIELGAVRFEGGQPVARYSELAAVDEPLDPFITRLTGIRDQDLTDRPRIEALLSNFLEFLGSDPIVGQNVQFDLGFLEAERKRISKAHRPEWNPGPVHDTVPIARAFLPTLASYGLGALARQFNVSLDRAHRAVHDAEATGFVLIELLKRARRTPFGELNEMNLILGGAAFTLGELIDGLSSIGSGEAGVDALGVLRDNRIGVWDGENNLAPQPIEDEESFLADFLADDGPLSKQVPGFQRRVGQVRMAQETYVVLKAGGSLMAEAGTGTGKSFAYLLPALLHARIQGGRVVVSTQTRHLQNQLFEKDLPALDAALGGGVRAVLLKGRGNYICKRRYEALVADPDRLEPAEREALLPLVRWLNRTRTGDIGEVTGFRTGMVRGLWQKISADSGYCSGRVCRATPGCFLHRIRTSAQRAHVVLVNHALLFSDLSSEGGVLGEYDKVIFDEAHHIERIAADHLGISWSAPVERLLLHSLYDPKQKKGTLAGLRAYSALLRSELERKSADADPLDEAMDFVGEAIRTGDEVGEELDVFATKGEEENGGYARRRRYLSGEELLADFIDLVHAHRRVLEKLQKTLDGIAREFEEADVGLVEGDDVLGEFRRQRGEVTALRESFNRLTGPGEENTVFWYEASLNNRQGVRLQGAPLDIGSVLREKLYPKLT